MLSGRGLCDKLITRTEEFYRLCCVVVCDLETSRMGAPYIYDISRLRVNLCVWHHIVLPGKEPGIPNQFRLHIPYIGKYTFLFLQ